MKKILVVIDYQNDFVNGALGFEKAVKLEDSIALKIEQYKNNGDEVVFTFDTHTIDYLNTQEGRNLPIQHCVKGTHGWELYGKIAGFCDDKTRCFEKNTFGSMEMAEYLKQNEYEQVELVGVVSNICVISNAILAKAALPEAQIIVDSTCVASNDGNLNIAALDVMKSLQIKID
jgi:nicotinamidase-related amidase